MALLGRLWAVILLPAKLLHMTETADIGALVALATSLAAEAKSHERRARDIKQQSAALRDYIITTLQPQGGTR